MPYIQYLQEQGELNERQKHRLDFWTKFNDLIDERGKPFNKHKPSTDHWYTVAVGSSKCHISIDLVPDFTREALNDKFTNDFQVKGKTMLKNYLKLFLTNNFIEFFLSQSGLDGEVQLSRINKKSKNRLIENLKRFTFEITGFNEGLAKVTIGGIDLKNINPKTMESTLIPNLYFAGEVLDLDGPTGGYNLKIAFSTGYLAGLSASEKQF